MPRVFHKFYFRLRTLFAGKRLEEEMEQEMKHHLELQSAELREEGVSPEGANLAASRDFGNITYLRERCRDEQSFPWLRQLAQDLHYGGRMLYNHPGFTVAVVATLALGIGANTAIFSLVDDILFRTLPVKEPSQLVLFQWTSDKDLPVPTHGDWTSDPITKQPLCSSFTQLCFERFKDQNQIMEGVFAFADLPKLTVLADNSAEVVNLGEIVSGGFFNILGVSPFAGRLIEENDDLAGTAPVMVISYGYWQRRFGGDPSIIGKSISVNHQLFTLIGIAPRRFAGTLQVGDAPDFYLPLSCASRLGLSGGALMTDPAKLWWLRIMGRRKEDVSLSQVKASLETTFQQTARESLAALGQDGAKLDAHPMLIAGLGGQGLTELRQSYAQEWKILAGLAVTLLVIACANIASLLLARANARRREIGIRLATGAGRGRIVRQLLTESMMLAILGGALAVPIALIGETVLVMMQPPLDGHILVLDPHLDIKFFAVAAAFSLFTGVMIGLLPALRAKAININAEFQGSSGMRGGAHYGLRSAMSKILLMIQVGLSLVLLVGAGLFINTLRNLKKIDVGFNPQRILLFQLNPNSGGSSFDLGAEKNRLVAERIRGLAGVQACTFSKMPLLSVMGWNTRISVPGRPNGSAEPATAMVNAVSDEFFSTYGMPILLGRALEAKDETGKRLAAVINQAMATTFFGNENPVGRTIEQKGFDNTTVSIEIVGVSRNASYSNVRDPVPPTIYFPFSFAHVMPSAEGTFAVRTTGNPRDLVPALRQVVQSVDPLLPIDNLRTQQKQIDELSAHERLFAWLSGFFSVLATSLVSIGLYGLLSYTVIRRTSEIGLRAALGSPPRKILWLILRECLSLVGAGIAIGVAAAYAATRIISSLLYGLTATDTITFITSALLLLTLALFAGWIPARRAARLDPTIALRYD